MYVLTAATDADKPWLDQLRRDAYRDLFDATWGGWDEERHQRHFAETWRAGHISIISVNGQQVGILQLIERPDSLEVGEIQIRPEHQNAGLGSRVLSDVLEHARQQYKPVTLYLGLKNTRAFELYKRLGFAETGRSDTHIYMRCEH